MSKENNLTDFLTDVADAIREKKGTTEKINPQNFADEIATIKAGGERRRVSYIRREKSGYIDTGIPGGNSNLTVRIKYAIKTFPSGYWNFVAAYVNESTNSTRILIQKNTAVLGSLNSVANSSAQVSEQRYAGIIYTDEILPESSSKYKLKANGTAVSWTRTNGTALSRNIFICPSGTDAVDVYIYQCEIYDGSTLVRNFIPDYQNGEFGMYDTVSGQFFGNAGSGTFGGEIITLE